MLRTSFTLLFFHSQLSMLLIWFFISDQDFTFRPLLVSSLWGHRFLTRVSPWFYPFLSCEQLQGHVWTQLELATEELSSKACLNQNQRRRTFSFGLTGPFAEAQRTCSRRGVSASLGLSWLAVGARSLPWTTGASWSCGRRFVATEQPRASSWDCPFPPLLNVECPA